MAQGTALLYIFLSVIVGVVSLVAWAYIFSKAGYSGWMCLLLIIPVVNVITFLWFAFSDWPVTRGGKTKNTLPS
jgi:uncharacterized membrane protein YhaH (DUF805 family)